MNISECDVSRTNKRNAMIFLEALLMGQQVKIADTTYAMCRTVNDGYQLVMVLEDGHVLGADMSIGSFVKLAMDNDEDANLTAMNNTLNLMKGRKESI